METGGRERDRKRKRTLASVTKSVPCWSSDRADPGNQYPPLLTLMTYGTLSDPRVIIDREKQDEK